MNFDLTDRQRDWQQRASAFAQRCLRDGVVERDAQRRFDRDAWRACAEFGALGLSVPERWGGLGLSAAETVAAVDGLAYGGRDLGLLYAVNSHLWATAMPIVWHGTDEQRARYLPRLCRGELIGANGISEADAGSDVFAMRTRAERRGDHYVLDGVKAYASNAPVCDLLLVYATVDPSLGAMGITCFLVERGAGGLRVGAALETMGLRTAAIAEVVLEGCRVPVEQRLGGERRGAQVFGSAMVWERACLPAVCLGAMRRQLDACVERARRRRQFGQSIGKLQAVASRIVDMKLRLEISRLLVHRAAALLDAGEDASTAASTAKLFVTEAFVASAHDAIAVFGGAGYAVEQQLERDLRDAVGLRLSSGTSEIQRNLVASQLGL